ncbi:MAG: sigma-54 dependent transcriptional regulator [Cardiobacteriaceae bacterium]|nr:sigma-54 dependent transcriptional regulator [Cardiobacteriaceae bacterium]
MSKALIIDDERDLCELIEMGLAGQGFACTSVHGIKAAIKTLKNESFDIAFCDIRLPDGDGIDLLAHMQKHYPRLPVCMITAHGNMDLAIRALKLGAFDFINKPFELKQLRGVAKAMLQTSQTAPATAAKAPDKSAGDRNEGKSASKTDLIGESPVMKQVQAMIEKVARSQAPVFIHGESGTGKEIAARSIHRLSNRGSGPFVAVNCGAIPENLVESEFFGYKKGSFTGANSDQDGLFVAANGGTLFLDEVADLPLAMQVKLLRAIQERAVRPIGADHEEPVDVRIISATHHDLARCVANKTFREDLFYRLNVIGLDMPPLREREGDIAILSRYLLERLIREYGYPQTRLSPAALAKLESYAFPGNVRELENILERALTFFDGDVIDACDIHIMNLGSTPAPTRKVQIEEEEEDPFSFLPAMPKENTEAPAAQAALPKDLEDYMQNLEKDLLLKALADADNNKTRAAEMLGISFRAMRYKLKKLGIE